GSTRLLSSPDSGTVNDDFAGASVDGSRVFFTTEEAILGTGDADQGVDLYERSFAVPSFSSPAVVAGVPGVGSTLTCAPGARLAESATTPLAWFRDGTPIAGAAGARYVAAAGDLHHQIACRVTATNPIGSASQISRAVTVALADHARPSVRILAPACP